MSSGDGRTHVVGIPKKLDDLARMDANLAVRCRSCGGRRVYDRAMLGSWLSARAANSAWSEIPRAIPCRCGSINLSLLPTAGGQPIDPDMRPYQRALVDLAVQVLRRACERAELEAIDTVDVRLALRVLRPWVEGERLVAFWNVSAADRAEWRAPAVRKAGEAIVRELRMMGRVR